MVDYLALESVTMKRWYFLDSAYGYNRMGEHLRRWPNNCLKRLKATSLQQSPLTGSVRCLFKLQALPSISQNEDEAFPHLQSSEGGHSNKKPRGWEVSQLERGSLYRHMDLSMDP